MVKILVVSPHRDDAAFSLSIAMTNWLLARHTVTLLNVFTRSRYAPYSDADFVHENDRMSYVSAMRLREDEGFLRRVAQELPRGLKDHIQMVDLNLKDAPIRLRLPEDEVCDTAVNTADPAIEKIRKAIARQAEMGAMDAMVVPLGLGRDVDHMTVREAALPLMHGVACAFYEDLPYAATHASVAADLDAVRDAMSGSVGRLSPVVCAADGAVERKRVLVLGYASQIDDEAGGVMSEFAARYGGGERLWANEAWVAAAEANRLSVPQG
jgi:hypothetical protein